jgi:hypothetical protein
MLNIIRLKKIGQIAVGTSSKQNKLDNMNNTNHIKPAGISGIMREYLKDKINELTTNRTKS